VTHVADLLARLDRHNAVWVTVRAHRGSVPREAGAWMAVFANDAVGTIGGGHLEWQAIAQARAMLSGHVCDSTVRYPLGSSLGQCCGGEVTLGFERVGAADKLALQARFDEHARHWPRVALFGGGHVGAALVRLLGELPLNVLWLDSRDEIFPPHIPNNVVCEHSDPVESAVAQLAPGSLVLIMSFSHAQDLEVVAACLRRQRERADLGLIGLIGSATKWRTFAHRLGARGFSETELALVTCPIGLPGIGGKEPEVIAVSVAAQVLQAVSSNTLMKDV